MNCQYISFFYLYIIICFLFSFMWVNMSNWMTYWPKYLTYRAALLHEKPVICRQMQNLYLSLSVCLYVMFLCTFLALFQTSFFIHRDKGIGQWRMILSLTQLLSDYILHFLIILREDYFICDCLFPAFLSIFYVMSLFQFLLVLKNVQRHRHTFRYNLIMYITNNDT